ncbi:MAG: zinc ribbon domain-containing protein [Candidatus Riflebacteria bacterium]|jgi:putative FmdB family regulatory protein|nr:zinc ribbon domain-containing protein [Candidatus Riflebacteria bacterium]MDD3376838.1 zinc ribbon domain-containing protein [Candidatus Riflebacteria bacterium]NCB46256.1 zinc ribbon domain-containing protein [bacterium]NLV93681.1 zinc ribbon domain-containing protein [Candidatus Riflebacteria bacterium]
MPLYEFFCRDCNKYFEVLAAISKRDETHSCERCGNNNIKRVMGKTKKITSKAEIFDYLTNPEAYSHLQNDNDADILLNMTKLAADSVGENIGEELKELAEEEKEREK